LAKALAGGTSPSLASSRRRRLIEAFHDHVAFHADFVGDDHEVAPVEKVLVVLQLIENHHVIRRRCNDDGRVIRSKKVHGGYVSGARRKRGTEQNDECTENCTHVSSSSVVPWYR
jgi:hypothetical protein